VEAGIDSLEHGTSVSEQSFTLMAARGIDFCPTIVAAAYGLDHPEGVSGPFYTPERLARLEVVRERLYRTVETAHHAGVRIVAGFDTDVAVVRGDPLADPGVFLRPDTIVAVLKRGVIVHRSEP